MVHHGFGQTPESSEIDRKSKRRNHGSIGKRYRREDEIGTPYCITVDFDTVGDEAKGIAADNCVTVRDRDTMEQVRMPISELKSYIESKIEF